MLTALLNLLLRAGSNRVIFGCLIDQKDIFYGVGQKAN